MTGYIPNPFVIPVGLVIGLLIAAPVGPVNVLCIQRVLERGVLGGIAAGLGAVLGDGLIALSAALGVSAISGILESHRLIIQAIGGLTLIGFGVLLIKRPADLARGAAVAASMPSAGGQNPGEIAVKDYAWDIPKAFLLTITNPGALLGLFAIFSGVSSFVEVKRTIDALVMVAAIMAGSLAWWVGLSALVASIRHRVSDARLASINRAAGLLLIGFGVLLIGELLYPGSGVRSALAWIWQA